MCVGGDHRIGHVVKKLAEVALLLAIQVDIVHAPTFLWPPGFAVFPGGSKMHVPSLTMPNDISTARQLVG